MDPYGVVMTAIPLSRMLEAPAFKMITLSFAKMFENVTISTKVTDVKSASEVPPASKPTPLRVTRVPVWPFIGVI